MKGISIFKCSNIWSLANKQLFGLCLLITPLLSLANSLPPSVIENNIETFTLNCPNNAQTTTYEINNCQITIISQLKAVEAKYIKAIQSRLRSEYADNKTQLSDVLIDFGQENCAWDKLIKTSANATYSYWQGGTIRVLMSSDRQIELLKYRIHNQWQNWLTFMDNSSPILPEPKFINQTEAK